MVGRPADAGAFREEHGRFAVGPASAGEEGGAGGEADVNRELGV